MNPWEWLLISGFLPFSARSENLLNWMPLYSLVTSASQIPQTRVQALTIYKVYCGFYKISYPLAGILRHVWGFIKILEQTPMYTQVEKMWLSVKGYQCAGCSRDIYSVLMMWSSWMQNSCYPLSFFSLTYLYTCLSIFPFFHSTYYLLKQLHFGQCLL